MLIADRKKTARQAAQEFAETAFETKRRIGKWESDALTPRFQLVGGMGQWYAVLLADDGWEIVCDLC